MTQTIESRRIKDLLTLLESLRELYRQLLTLVQSKIDAMRRADTPAMQTLSEQEQALAGRIQEREGFRHQLMDAIGEELHMPPRAARALPMSQLASRLCTRQRSALTDAAGRLREVVAKVTQANRVAGAVSREILNHMKWVFSAVRPRDAEPVGYSGDGALVGPADHRIFETVG